jgi:hypothetical protein
MTGADEQELRSRLDTALMTITPRPAPIDTVMRQGRHVMYRRRVSVTAGLAAVALAAVAVPSLLNQHAARPAVTRPAAVTVLPPGPGSLAGLIASGTVGATRWSVRLTGHGCFAVTGATVACQAYTPPDGIATFTGVGGEGYTTEFGPVKPAVTRVTVVLGDGQLLVLHPVRAAGLRWVAFPVPAGTEVLRLTAYAGRTGLRHTVHRPRRGLQRAQYQRLAGTRCGRAPTGHSQARPGHRGVRRPVGPLFCEPDIERHRLLQ